MARRALEYLIKVTGTEKAAASLRVVSAELDNHAKKSRRSRKEADTFRASFERMGAKIGSLAPVLGAASAAITVFGAAAAKATLALMDHIQAIDNMATRLGIAKKTLAGLALGADAAGLSIRALGEIVNPLNLRLAQARSGASNVEEVFLSWGISLRDTEGAIVSTDEALSRISATLASIEDPSVRSQAAIQLMGESGAKLVQVLGDRRIEEFIERAERLGPDMDRSAEGAANLSRAISEVKLAAMGVLDALTGFGLFEKLVRFITLNLEDLRVKLLKIATAAQLVTDVLAGRGTDAALKRWKELDKQVGQINKDVLALVGLTAGPTEGTAAGAAPEVVPFVGPILPEKQRKEIERERAAKEIEAAKAAKEAAEAAAEAAEKMRNQFHVLTQQQLQAFAESGEIVGGRRISEFAPAFRMRTQFEEPSRARVLAGQIAQRARRAAQAVAGIATGVAGAVGVAQTVAATIVNADEFLSGFKTLLMDAISSLPTVLTDVIPDFVSALISDLVPALLKLLFQLPKILAEMVANLAKAIVDAINPFKRRNKERNTEAGRKHTFKEFLEMPLKIFAKEREFAHGGMVTQTGFVLAHAGEVIDTPGRQNVGQTSARRSGGINVTIHNNGNGLMSDEQVRLLIRQIRLLVGDRQSRASLSGFAT